jgi:hypothetical protein
VRRDTALGARDRLLWVALKRSWPRWADALIIVKPETVVAWHRAGFRLYWRWKSRARGKPGRPSVVSEVRDLVRRMGKETPAGRPVTARPSDDAKVVAFPRVGGVHHRYEWREAA